MLRYRVLMQLKLTDRCSVSEDIDEHAQARYKEEARILRQRTVPSRLDGIDIESLLCQFCGILGKDRGCARLEYRECHDGPEHPRKFQHLFELELLVLLGQLLLGCCIATSLVVAIAVLVEEPERCTSKVGKKVHENRRPKNPGKVPCFLCFGQYCL